MTHGETSARWTDRLLRDGYCIIPDLLPSAILSRLEADLEPDFRQTPFGHGDFYGYRTKRFGSLLRRSSYAADLVREPTVLEIANSILKPACERIQLNVAQAIEIHPGEVEQFPHCDHDMWAGIKGHHEYLVNVMWAHHHLYRAQRRDPDLSGDAPAAGRGARPARRFHRRRMPTGLSHLFSRVDGAWGRGPTGHLIYAARS